MTQHDSSPRREAVHLEDIFITHDLERRPRRLPDYQAENRGLVELARGLAQAPGSILQRVTEMARELCHAETAGISLIEQYEGHAVFRWRALAGVFASHLGGMTPRDFSPCGIVVDRRQTQLVSVPGRYYPYLNEAQPPIAECLLLPFFVAGEVRGTLWLMAHDERRKFDAEDVRVLSSLAEFTAAAYQVTEAVARVHSKQAELERSNRELEQFAASVSHDLREPLRTVTSYTQLLAQRYHGRLDHEADEFIAFTVAGAQRMEQRIEALLALAHLSTGSDFLPTSLAMILEEVVADLHSQLTAAGATVQHDPLPTVRGHAGQLRSLLQNLITNAVKFRHPDRRPHVRVSATKAHDQWEISVADNGIGIAEQHCERVFEVFQRLHTSREYEGLGMGLAMCKKIVERHGGHIRVESAPGQGATFVFTLPV